MAKWLPAFQELTAKTHTEQGIWWLNGFWKEGAEGYAEDVWAYVHKCIEIEAGRPKLYGSKVWDVQEGCDLDELKAHQFLEQLGETLTVVDLRARLKELDIDNNKRMALSEYLLGKYPKHTPQDLVDSPQGGDVEAAKLAAAKAAVKAASEALTAALSQEEASKAAAREAAAATKELEAAVAELEKEQKAQDDKVATFQATIDNKSLSGVKRMRAKNELAQFLSEDPLPLRKAKITQSAALKRAQKAEILAEEEKAKAIQKRADAQQALQEAEHALAELKKKGDGVAKGAVWWLDRELLEIKKFMPNK